MSTQVRATIEDLYSLPHDIKAEIVDGEIVIMSPTGAAPNYAAGEIFASLRAHCRKTKVGVAVTDNAAFRVYLPNRESFSPDAAYYIGKWTGMKFFDGAPVFAVEVRSSDGYGPAAEKAMADKRADYFAAGTLVVWDVDLLGDDVIKAYLANDPEKRIIFRRGEIANAEPAVPGWSIAVDDLFPALGDVDRGSYGLHD
jgi:Uma2 family endonuclease